MMPIAWFCPEHHGVIVPGGRSWRRPSPPLSASAEILAIVGRPVKYYGRMPPESRAAACAASLALDAVTDEQNEPREIGLISAGFDGCLEADRNYFADYVAGGRTLGRGNLFIYTLPTSAPGEVAIALGLTGPCLFVQDESDPLRSLIEHARHLVADGEADRMLALWSDPRAAVCMVVDGEALAPADDAVLRSMAVAGAGPLQMARELQLMVQPT